jgi:phenylacetate-CoA ligase
MRAATIHKDLANPDYVQWTKFLDSSDEWSVDLIREYEFSEIKRIVRHAYGKTSGYRKVYDSAGIKPENIESAEDFKKIPFVTKEHIRDSLEDFSVDLPNRQYVTTGGSTGIPFGMYRTQTAFAKELASKAHQYYRIGWREGDRQMVMRGIPIENPTGAEFFPEYNELRCSTYQFIPEKMRFYRETAFEYQPEWLRCYPSSGFLFASFLADNGLDFPALKGVLCASEMLYDFQKEKLEDVFGCRVFSHYGHYELSALAGFCEYTDDYHVLPQYGYVELIGENGETVSQPGQTGEIVATSFIMDATPFVRYKTGDLAVFKSWGCERCGRPYQVWEKVVGRRQEMIVSKNGRLISMTMLNMHDDIYDDLQQYQFYQKEPGKVVLRFVPKESCREETLADIKNRLYKKLGDDIDLELQKVEKIMLTKRGKHRTLVQELKSENQALVLE